jgi:methylenetetrahydrofolate reductase (NADPH)
LRIRELMDQRQGFVSLEFFPPKDRAAWPGFFQVIERLKRLDPLFVSVTYGAGGSTRDKTLEIVSTLKGELGLEPMAHLTCVDASRERIREFLDTLREQGVDNVLALRGDPPKGEESFTPTSGDFCHASDLVRLIRHDYPEFGVGVAGYPEGHLESEDLVSDMTFLKHKLDQGADFVVTQLFFENRIYFDFVDRARSMGITQPIIPGILPIMSLSVIKKGISLSGASMPEELLARLEEADRSGGNDAVQELGIVLAREQIRELLQSGVPGVHLYTLNKADACLAIMDGLSE